MARQGQARGTSGPGYRKGVSCFVVLDGARDDFAGAWPDVLDELARRVSSQQP
jgi:hypothetical protein